MADKGKLKDMVDALVDGKPEEAEVAFHGYAKDKMREELGGQAGVEDPVVTDDVSDDE